MTIIDAQSGPNGFRGLGFPGNGPGNGQGIGPGNGRGATPVAELPERQYRRVVAAQERSLQARFGNGQTLTADQAGRAQAAFDRLQSVKQARTAFLAQQIAQQDSESPAAGAGSKSAAADPGQAAIDAFRKFMSMTPEERLFELLLKKRGLTREELDALPPEEREKVIAEITEEIREKIEKKSASAGTTNGQATSETASAARPVGQQGAELSIDSTGSAAAVSQRDITSLAEKRSPTGKVGFEDVLILATAGRDGLSRLTGENDPGRASEPAPPASSRGGASLDDEASRDEKTEG